MYTEFPPTDPKLARIDQIFKIFTNFKPGICAALDPLGDRDTFGLFLVTDFSIFGLDDRL